MIELDCQVVINCLFKCATFLSDLDTIFYDILFSSTSVSSLVWSHVKRDRNFVAHHLAKLVPFGLNKFGKTTLPQKWHPIYSWMFWLELILAQLNFPPKKNLLIIRDIKVQNNVLACVPTLKNIEEVYKWSKLYISKRESKKVTIIQIKFRRSH